MTMTARESRFVDSYLQGTSAEAACIAAGYKPGYARKSSHLLLKRPEIAQAIENGQAKLRNEAEMTAEKLLAMFLDVYEKAIEWRQSMSAVRAGEAIGKLTGLLTDRLKLEIEAKPSLIDAIEAGRIRASGRSASSIPLLIDVTPAS